MKRVITFGTFDILHTGHIRFLEKAKALGDILIVGVAGNDVYLQLKKTLPILDEKVRLEIVKSLSCVDNAFISSDETQSVMNDIIEFHNSDIIALGEDNKRSDNDFRGKIVKRLTRYPQISSSDIKEKIKKPIEEKLASYQKQIEAQKKLIEDLQNKLKNN